MLKLSIQFNKLGKYLFSLLLSMFVWQAPFAQAQNQFNLDSLQSGQVLLNVSATERVEIDQDTLNITLQTISTGRDRVALQHEINSTMAKVLEILKTSSLVEYSIERYQVYLTQDRNRPAKTDSKKQTWRAQQSVQLKSTDSAAALDLTRQLQELSLIVQNMHYSLSSTKHAQISDSLMNAALDKLQARADVAAGSLQKQSAQLIEVTVNGGQNVAYRGRAMAMEMDYNMAESIAPPIAQPGKTEVSLTVSARALLSP